MPARVLRQDPEIKELFRARIREKVEQEKERMRGRIDEGVPSWIRWAVKPLAEWRFDAVRARDRARGDGGEDSAALHFWLLLSGEWILINDAVLEPESGEFIQVDHVLVGPPGVFLVETKAWEGAFLAVRDEWRHKEGSSWVRCESPTRQSLRHKRLFVEWLRGLGLDLPGDPDGFVFPIVLLTRCGWLKAEGCSVPIFGGGRGPGQTTMRGVRRGADGEGACEGRRLGPRVRLPGRGRAGAADLRREGPESFRRFRRQARGRMVVFSCRVRHGGAPSRVVRAEPFTWASTAVREDGSLWLWRTAAGTRVCSRTWPACGKGSKARR